MRHIAFASCAAIGLTTAAHADPLTVNAAIGAMPAMPSYNVLTFDGPAPAGVSLGLSGDAAIVSGTVPLVHVAPDFEGGQGSLNGVADGADIPAIVQFAEGHAIAPARPLEEILPRKIAAVQAHVSIGYVKRESVERPVE